MLVCEFENLALEYDNKYNEIHNLLTHLGSIPSIWKKDKNTFFIISKSAKQPNKMQLTQFNNNVPIFDMIRSDFKDFTHELVINDCNIEQINYIQ
jgi:hypothetical protein